MAQTPDGQTPSGQAPFGPGTVLAGRFTLEDLLDDSGGARFWRATDRTLARSVAVHVLPVTDPRSAALLTAARTSALVTDGHLLRVLDAAEEDGVVYVVNEWGNGVSLDRLLAEGPLSPRRAAWVVKEVAEAIAIAHRHGVAHGRLLPENVMISEAGSVKLIGFVVDAVIRSQAGRDQVRVTGGEPMSAHESDVVNLAGLLYAALVGRWPGTEGSVVPPAPAEHDRPLRPRQVRAGVPRPLDAICERVLNPGPSTVPIETAHEVYAALSDYIGDPTGAPQWDATSVLGVEDLPGHASRDGHRPSGPDAHRPSDLGGDTVGSDLGPATEMHPAARPTGFVSPLPSPDRAGEGNDHDDEDDRAGQTQAGAPVFFDEDTGVGWMPEPQARGVVGSGWATDDDARRTPAPPAPAAPRERPLFASGPARAPYPGSGDDGTFPRSTGAGNGRVPDAWGPDVEDGGGEHDEDWHEDPAHRPGTRWLRLAAIVAVLLVAVVGGLIAYNLNGAQDQPPAAQGSTSSSPSASRPARTPVDIAAVSDFDPQGDPAEEHPELAPLAVDGQPGTAWQTLTYRNNPRLGGLKSGVGLLVDLGRASKVGRVRLTLLGTPTSVEILAAPDADTAPTSTDGLDRVAARDNAGERVTLDLADPVTTRYLVVWLTSLPPAPGGYQGRIAEIAVSS